MVFIPYIYGIPYNYSMWLEVETCSANRGKIRKMEIYIVYRVADRNAGLITLVPERRNKNINKLQFIPSSWDRSHNRSVTLIPLCPCATTASTIN